MNHNILTVQYVHFQFCSKISNKNSYLKSNYRYHRNWEQGNRTIKIKYFQKNIHYTVLACDETHGYASLCSVLVW